MREMRRLNAWLGGQDLRSLDPRILIREISEDTPEIETDFGTWPGRAGQIMLTRERRSLRVAIRFAIRELYDLAARAQVLDTVNAWAQDGYLSVSYRPQRRLYVYRVGPAAPDTIRDYTAEYTVAFEAVASPYWEDVSTTSWTASGASGSGTLAVRGNLPACVEATVTPTGGTLSTLTLTVGGTSMTFSGLGVPNGTAFRVAYDERGLLGIGTASASKLSCRSAASADDLIAGPGSADVSFTAGTACTVTLEARGRWQ